MAEHTKEIDEQELDRLGMAFLAFHIGIGTILCMWFLSGLYYVILK
jgi:hypothetical protein